eukprot:gene9746-6834_t
MSCEEWEVVETSCTFSTSDARTEKKGGCGEALRRRPLLDLYRIDCLEGIAIVMYFSVQWSSYLPSVQNLEIILRGAMKTYSFSFSLLSSNISDYSCLSLLIAIRFTELNILLLYFPSPPPSMQIDFNRFASSQRYYCAVPLEKIALRVTITRALIVEENHIETVADTIIPWNAKVFSPSEQIATWNKLRNVLKSRQSSRSSAAGGRSPSPPPGARDSRSPASPGSMSSLQSSLFHCPTPKELLHELSQPRAWLFTRPSGEDYIDVRQEECPVLPPQGASRLAPVILRRHRYEHLPSNNFYIAWADGITSCKSSAAALADAAALAAGQAERAGPQRPSNALTPSSASVSRPTAPSQASGGTGSSSSAADEDLELHWEGEEYIFCTIRMEQSELRAYFTAKPTLFEEHTLRVDSSHIYRFRIVPQLKALASAEEPGEGLMDAVPHPAGASLANATGALSSVVSTHCPVLVADSLAPGPSVVLPPAAAAAAAATSTAPAVAAVPKASAAGPITRELLKAVAQTVPRGAGIGPAQVAALRLAGPPATSGQGGTAAQGTDEGSTSDLAPGTNPNTRAVRFGAVHAPGQTFLHTGRTHYFVFGTVERCVGAAESTLFARCELYRSVARYTQAAPNAPLDDSTADGERATGAGTTCTFCSQLAYAGTVMEADYWIAEPEHVFNLPFEFSYAESHEAPPPGHPPPPPAPLRLAIGLYTEGYDGAGLQSACAYGCVSLPVASPGSHSLRVPVWAIHKTGKEALKSAVVGGAPSFIDLRQAGPFPEAMVTGPSTVTTSGDGIGSRHGLVSDSIGFVYIRVHILEINLNAAADSNCMSVMDSTLAAAPTRTPCLVLRWISGTHSVLQLAAVDVYSSLRRSSACSNNLLRSVSRRRVQPAMRRSTATTRPAYDWRSPAASHQDLVHFPLYSRSSGLLGSEVDQDVGRQLERRLQWAERLSAESAYAESRGQAAYAVASAAAEAKAAAARRRAERRAAASREQEMKALERALRVADCLYIASRLACVSASQPPLPLGYFTCVRELNTSKQLTEWCQWTTAGGCALLAVYLYPHLWNTGSKGFLGCWI